jgi:hypothetical protein
MPSPSVNGSQGVGILVGLMVGVSVADNGVAEIDGF